MDKISKRIPVLVTIAATLLVGCSSTTKVLVPPRMDLARYGSVGMVEFSPTGQATLHREASREFMEAIQAAQPGTPILELGDPRRVLDAVAGSDWDPATVKAIGEQFDVDVLVVGVLEAKEVKPELSIDSGLRSVSASTGVEALLTAKMYDTRSGATVWTTSARDRQKVAGVSISSTGVSGSGSTGTDNLHNRMVSNLVAVATNDFRAHWVRQ
jgi:hypothetical protein